MNITLRPYQENLKNKTREAFKSYKRVIMLAPCGSGKTITAVSIMKDSIAKGKKVWFVVHRRELQAQAENTLERYGVPTDNIKVYMVQTLANKLDKITETPDMIIFDECFIKGTLVDGKPIENIKVGDYVKSFNHNTNTIEFKKVLNVFKRKPNKLLKIKLNNGKEIICTSNHPFYTKNGYVEAYKLKEKDELYLLWENDNGRNNGKFNKTSKRRLQKNRKMVLFSRMFKEICFFSKFKTNERKQSNEYAWNKRKNDKNFKRNDRREESKWRKMVQSSRRKWQRLHCTSNNIKRAVRRLWTSNGICSTNKSEKRKWLSNLLQNRYRITRLYGSDRSGWRKSQYNRETKSRQEKARIFRRAWVESVEIQEQTSDGTFGGLCKDGYVYNIEVEDNNNYFANEVLVHNCQHATSNTYLKIIKKFPNAYILGLSATPSRLSGKPLGDVFETIVSEITAKQLMDMGYLAQYDYYAPQLDVDMSKVRKRAGDYDANDLDTAMSTKKIYGDIIKTYKKLANNKKTIIYAPTVEYSKKMEQLFTEKGFSIRHFDGTTPKAERDQIIENFRTGKIKILTNVDLVRRAGLMSQTVNVYYY